MDHRAMYSRWILVMTNDFIVSFLGVATIIMAGSGVWLSKGVVNKYPQKNILSKQFIFRILGVAWVVLIVTAFTVAWPYIFLSFNIFVNEWLALAFTSFLLVGLSLRAYYSCCTPMVTGLWLRRFHVEPEAGFKLSRMFERLSISDIRILTLADTKVDSSSLSGKQSQIKLGLDILVFILFPISMLILFAFIWINVIFNYELISQKIFIPSWFISEYFLPFLFLMSLVMFFSGIIHFVLNLKRIKLIGSGYTVLKHDRLAAQIESECDRVSKSSISDFLSGKRIYRVSDEDWKAAVSAAIENVDLIFFDATDYSDQMQWELDEICRKNKLRSLLVMSENEVADKRFTINIDDNVPRELPEPLSYGAISKSGKAGERAFQKIIKESAFA